MAHPGHIEIQAVNATIDKLFEAISFQEGHPANIERLKEVFIEGGLLIDQNDESPEIRTVEAFIQQFQERVNQGTLKGLDEREIHHKTKVYDRIAHRYSFYEVRTHPDTDPIAVGINSIQLVRQGDQWKVSSMTWNDDHRGDGFFERTMACINQTA